MPPITLNLTSTWTTVSPCPPDVRRLLNETFAYLSPDANEHNPAYTNGRWDGIIRLFDPVRSRIPAGLTVRAFMLLKTHGYDVTVARPDAPPLNPLGYPARQGPTLRGYQHQAVGRALSTRYGIIQAPTGAGKTEIMGEIIGQGPANQLIVVPNRALHEQTIRRMKTQFPAAHVAGLTKDTPLRLNMRNIIVTTYQMLARPDAQRRLGDIQAVHVDEAHRIAADTFRVAVTHTPNAILRIGYTATSFRDDGRDLELTAWLGEELFSISLAQLIDEGYLVQPRFQVARDLPDAITLTEGRPTIIFTEKKETLLAYRETWEAHDIRVLTGDETKRTINAAIAELREGRLTAIACTPIMDEGLDVPRLECVIFLECFSGRGRLTQRIGRAMRLHPGKTECRVIDVLDRHYKKKREAYMQEPAFLRALT